MPSSLRYALVITHVALAPLRVNPCRPRGTFFDPDPELDIWNAMSSVLKRGIWNTVQVRGGVKETASRLKNQWVTTGVVAVLLAGLIMPLVSCGTVPVFSFVQLTAALLHRCTLVGGIAAAPSHAVLRTVEVEGCR